MNINELTAKLKAAALKAKSATEDYAAGRISITTCYSECAEFNSLTDGPDQILPLTEALEAAEKVSAARLEAIDRAHKMFQRERDRAEAAEKRYENRTPTEWAYGQACAAIENHRTRADTAEARIAELEARTLTVKLPEPKNSICSDWNGGFESAMQLAHDRIKLACADVGIKLQIEGE